MICWLEVARKAILIIYIASIRVNGLFGVLFLGVNTKSPKAFKKSLTQSVVLQLKELMGVELRIST